MTNKNKKPVLQSLIEYAIKTYEKDIHLLTINRVPNHVVNAGITLARLRQTMFAIKNNFSFEIDFDRLDSNTTDNLPFVFSQLTKEDIGGIGEAILNQLCGSVNLATPEDLAEWTDDMRNLPDMKFLEDLRVDVKTVPSTRKNIAVTAHNMPKYDFLLALQLFEKDHHISAELFLIKTFEDGKPRPHWTVKPGEFVNGYQKPDYFLIPINNLKKDKPND
jgi:hypothetical protein